MKTVTSKDGTTIAFDEVVKEADAVAEQERRDVNLHLIQQLRVECLLDDLRAARHQDIFVSRNRFGLGNGARHAVRDEMEGGAALFDERVAWMVGDDEDGGVKGRGVAPVWRTHVEHALAHGEGPHIAERLVQNLGILARLATFHAVPFAPAFEDVSPFMEPLAALAEAQFDAGVRPGDEAVQRHRDIYGYFSHEPSYQRLVRALAWMRLGVCCGVDVGNDLSQIIFKLMPTVLQWADGGLGQGLRVEGEMGERDGFVVAAVVKEEVGDGRERLGEIVAQGVFRLPILVLAPEWKREQEQPHQRALHLRFGEGLQHR
jgi:hypothetical protein